jgi:hypothetical protein
MASSCSTGLEHSTTDPEIKVLSPVASRHPEKISYIILKIVLNKMKHNSLLEWTTDAPMNYVWHYSHHKLHGVMQCLNIDTATATNAAC